VKQRLQHSPINYWSAALLWLAVGCAANTDETNLSDPERSQPYSDEAPATAGPTPDELGVLGGGPRVDIAQMIGREKIRAGVPTDASQGLANAVVAITAIDTNGNATGGGCTAQVINRSWLLTASHCLGGWPSGQGLGAVSVRNNANVFVNKYMGAVQVFAESNPQLRSKDTGLIFLVNGMDTCHGTTDQCPTSRPWNAVFQFFVPGSPMFLQSKYAIAGYGEAEDGGGNVSGILRMGSMLFSSAAFNNNNEGFTTQVSYFLSSQARGCHGDSGGPLIIPGGARLLHNGIASDANPTTCNSNSGTDFYSGLSLAQAAFVFNKVLSVAKMAHFGCGSGGDPASGLFVFHCDNDGSLYGVPQ
jgi:hypothetical protein